MNTEERTEKAILHGGPLCGDIWQVEESCFRINRPKCGGFYLPSKTRINDCRVWKWNESAQEAAVFIGGPLDGPPHQTSPSAISISIPSHQGSYLFDESSTGGKSIWRWTKNPPEEHPDTEAG